MIGAWHRTSGGVWYIAFHEDGTINGSAYLEAVVEGRGHDEWKYRFLGTQLIMQGSGGHCEENQIGIFEVHLLESGAHSSQTVDFGCAHLDQLSASPHQTDQVLFCFTGQARQRWLDVLLQSEPAVWRPACRS